MYNETDPDATSQALTDAAKSASNPGDAVRRVTAMSKVNDPDEAKVQVDTDLRDVMAEETSRGTKRPKKVRSLEETRRLTNIARLVRRKGYTEEEFISDLSEFVPDTASPEFRKLLKIWREYQRRFG